MHFVLEGKITQGTNPSTAFPSISISSTHHLHGVYPQPPAIAQRLMHLPMHLKNLSTSAAFWIHYSTFIAVLVASMPLMSMKLPPLLHTPSSHV